MALLAITAILAARAGRRFGAALAALIVVGGSRRCGRRRASQTRSSTTRCSGCRGSAFWARRSSFTPPMAAGGEPRGRAAPRVTGNAPRTRGFVRSSCSVSSSCGRPSTGRIRRVRSKRLLRRSRRPRSSACAPSAGRPLVRIDRDVWPVAAGVLLRLFRERRAVCGGIRLAADVQRPGRRYWPRVRRSLSNIAGCERQFLLTSDGRGVTLAEAGPFYAVLAARQ